jgi:hypothetical protein
MRHVGRDVDEVARAGFGRELQRVAPAHAGFALDDVDHAFQMPVMMRAGLRVGMDVDGASPQLLRTDSREVDGRFAVHARRLRRVRIELARGDDANAVVLPCRFDVR